MSWLRLLVVWIAVIAMPFQAHAAATMAFCGAQHGVAAHDAHDHGMRHPQAQGESGDPHHADPAPDPAADPAHRCATCGVCHAAALTGASTTVVVHDMPPADLAEPSFALATRTPSVPERPPRV